MKKRVEEIKFWQKKIFYKRFYKIDFPNGMVYIAEYPPADPDDKGTKTIPFGHILEALVFSENVGSEIASQCGSKTFRFPFKLRTTNRNYTLLASSM